MSRLTTDRVLARHEWLVGKMGLRYVLEERAYFLAGDRVLEAATMIGLINEDRFQSAVRDAVEAMREHQLATMTVIP